ncbi:hypothetical protein [Nitrosomonas sp.]|nr:hypothetical protein [Nitrosomonas sp.]MBV6446562.1 hypothetical protein [Nitrosomonas sp.]
MLVAERVFHPGSFCDMFLDLENVPPRIATAAMKATVVFIDNS